MNKENKTKLNIIDVILLFVTIISAVYITYYINITYKKVRWKTLSLQKTEKQNDEAIHKNEMYKRIDIYWYRLSTIEEIIRYKDNRIYWREYLQEFKDYLPKNLNIKNIRYAPEKNILTISLRGPDRVSLLAALKHIQSFPWLNDITFNGIGVEQITFKWDKVQYKSDATIITAKINKDYLYKKYEEKQKQKKEKYFNEPTEEELTGTWETVWTWMVVWTWAVVWTWTIETWTWMIVVWTGTTEIGTGMNIEWTWTISWTWVTKEKNEKEENEIIIRED